MKTFHESAKYGGILIAQNMVLDVTGCWMLHLHFVSIQKKEKAGRQCLLRFQVTVSSTTTDLKSMT